MVSRLHLFGWPFLEPPWGMTEANRKSAEQAASGHTLDEHYLPDLGATEADPDMHMLWQHCMRSQITPEALQRMDRKHLLYIAAHSGEVTYLVPQTGEQGKLIQGAPLKPVLGRNAKLQENAIRAKYELERRDRRNAAYFTTLIAASVGTVLGLIGGLLASGTWPL